MNRIVFPVLAGAALLLGSLMAAQAQTRHVPQRQGTQLPSMGSAFAPKNGGTFANQRGIAAGNMSPGAGVIGSNGASFNKQGLISENGLGFRR